MSATSAVIEYKDYVAILLTAVTVVLTTLAIGIGIVTIVGYRAIKTGAVIAARKAVDERLGDLLDGENIKDRLHEMVQSRLSQASDEVWADFAPQAYPTEEDGS